jgi:selenide,water dikinase
LSQKALTQVLRRLTQSKDPNLLVGASTADDAGVYRIDRNRALVQTVDFFTPIVDDPFLYGQIAAANSLSDVYAMGGRPLTAMNLLAVPTDLLPPEIINAILRGGSAKVKEAKCALARKTINVMRQINLAGAELAERGLVKAATDITGYGLLGHLGSMCRASGVGALIDSNKLPIISREVFDLIAKECIPGGSRENLETADAFTKWEGVTDARKIVAADAQTSGGLLLCVPPRHLDEVLTVLKRYRTPCRAVVGRIVRSAPVQITVQ